MTRISSRAAWIGVVALALAASPGCLVRRHKIERAARHNAPLLSAGVEQLAGTLKQHFEAIETLNATVDLEPAVLSETKGEIAEYKDVRGYILFRKPAWIRVIALYPVVRATAFDMVSDGETFRLYLPSKNLFLIGPNRVEKPSPKKFENLRPEHLLDALLIPPPASPQEHAVLENWSDGGTPSYILHIIRRESSERLRLARNIWFDRASLEIVRQRVFDERGDVVSDARYGGWDRRGPVAFPKQIIITRPKDEYELSIHFDKEAFNEPIGADKFDLAQPAGVKVQYVGEKPDKPAGGSGG